MVQSKQDQNHPEQAAVNSNRKPPKPGRELASAGWLAQFFEWESLQEVSFSSRLTPSMRLQLHLMAEKAQKSSSRHNEFHPSPDLNLDYDPDPDLGPKANLYSEPETKPDWAPPFEGSRI